MKLSFVRTESLPQLGWCAETSAGSQDVVVYCGGSVELHDGWCIEGVWAGSYAQGGFDLTSLVFGSGVRGRDDRVTFVSSGTLVDRLWALTLDGTYRVSNSLPIILAAGDVSLLDEHPSYPRDTNNAQPRFAPEATTVPVSRGKLEILYFHNFVYDGRTLRVAAKPEDAPRLTDYATYHGFLLRTAELIGGNASDPMRLHQVAQVATISSGYDSAAAAVVARGAGCGATVTIDSARAVVPRTDSGAPISRVLDLPCTVYPRAGRRHAREEAFWAALGSPQDANLAVFDYPEPLALLFTGVYGGRVWSPEAHMHPAQFRGADTNGLGFCEYRLIRGVFHCPVPFWGFARADDLFELSHAPEMKPWSIGGSYDRPVPRRILEDAGVPREMFGMKKSATHFEESFLWPYSPELDRSYSDYLRERGESPPLVSLYRILNAIDRRLLQPVDERFRMGWSRIEAPQSRMLFQWANHYLRDQYRSGLSSQAASRSSGTQRLH